MRIGEFAEHNNLSIDTVRYYVNLYLIHPIRRGKYFYFEKEQQEELDGLVHLKKLRFTLDEVKKIMTTRYLDKVEMSVKSRMYEDMLTGKRDELNREMSEISAALKGIEAELNRVDEKREGTYKERGVSFSDLELLCCPRCGKSVEISEGTLKGNGIYEGKSACECGYTLSIENGIIVTKQDFDSIIDPYVDGENYVDDSVNEAPKEFIDCMISSSREIIRLLLESRLSDKVLLFMKTGLGIFQANLFEQSPDIKLMIMVDDDFNKLRVAKKSIECNFPGYNVVYICSELHELPIKKKTVDIAVDFLATFLNGFRLDVNLYEHIIPILKDKSSIIGMYMYFKHFKMLSRLPESHRYIFDGRTIPKIITGYGFVEKGEYEETVLHEGSNINGFFKEGDSVYTKIMAFDRRGDR